MIDESVIPNMQRAKPILYYFHDPMCSWCYGFKATLEKLISELPAEVELKKVLGGLAPDTDETMPQSLQEQIRNNWLRIESTIPGVKFNYSFWQECQPRRATYAACRAVIAARQQGEQFDEQMTNAIQNAYYQQARNPSEDTTLIKLASELSLDKQQFRDDFYANKTTATLQQEIDFSRNMFVESFPSLILSIGDEKYPVKIDYNDYQVMLKQIKEKFDAFN